MLVDGYGVPKLCDFKPIPDIQGHIDSDAITKTTQSGEPRHLAHEIIALDAEPTTQSDIHALGCTMLEVNVLLRRRPNF